MPPTKQTLPQITREWLEEKNACSAGLEWDVKKRITDPIKGIENLVAKNNWQWANWLIVRVMTYKQYVNYAVFAAELVIDIYEKRNPDSKKPRKAIEAAKKCITDPSSNNKKAAANAAAYAD